MLAKIWDFGLSDKNRRHESDFNKFTNQQRFYKNYMISNEMKDFLRISDKIAEYLNECDLVKDTRTGKWRIYEIKDVSSDPKLKTCEFKDHNGEDRTIKLYFFTPSDETKANTEESGISMLTSYGYTNSYYGRPGFVSLAIDEFCALVLIILVSAYSRGTVTLYSESQPSRRRERYDDDTRDMDRDRDRDRDRDENENDILKMAQDLINRMYNDQKRKHIEFGKPFGISFDHIVYSHYSTPRGVKVIESEIRSFKSEEIVKIRRAIDTLYHMKLSKNVMNTDKGVTTFTNTGEIYEGITRNREYSDYFK